MMSVSIAMATYNGEQHIKRQLESLAVQTHPPRELVVTDDASDDHTVLVLTSFGKHAPFPVRVYRNSTRLGYRRNFMLAASLCSSELIAFCDQDDVWYPEKLATCVERFTEPEVLLVYHNADVVTDDGKQIASLKDSLRVYAAEPTGPIVSWTPVTWALGFTEVFRRSILKLSSCWASSVDPVQPSELMAHDQWFFFLASALGKIGYISQPLVAYVQHGQNTYGWSGTTHNSTGARTAMSVKIWNYFATNPEYFSQHGEILRRLSVVLALVKLEVDGKWTERAGQAAETYQRVADAYCGRARIYTSSSFRKRLSAFRQVLGTDAYGDGLIFGSRSFIKDLCVGVPIGPFVTGRLLF